VKEGAARARRTAAWTLLAIAACAPARRETPPEIPPESLSEVEVDDPVEPRWWVEVVPRDGALDLVLPENSSYVPAPVPADLRVEVAVALGGGLPDGVRERVAAHEGEPLVAFVSAEPEASLRDVLETLARLHEAGIRRFDPASLLGELPARGDRE